MQQQTRKVTLGLGSLAGLTAAYVALREGCTPKEIAPPTAPISHHAQKVESHTTSSKTQRNGQKSRNSSVTPTYLVSPNGDWCAPQVPSTAAAAPVNPIFKLDELSSAQRTAMQQGVEFVQVIPVNSAGEAIHLHEIADHQNFGSLGRTRFRSILDVLTPFIDRPSRLQVVAIDFLIESRSERTICRVSVVDPNHNVVVRSLLREIGTETLSHRFFPDIGLYREHKPHMLTREHLTVPNRWFAISYSTRFDRGVKAQSVEIPGSPDLEFFAVPEEGRTLTMLFRHIGSLNRERQHFMNPLDVSVTRNLKQTDESTGAESLLPATVHDRLLFELPDSSLIDRRDPAFFRPPTRQVQERPADWP